jgi:uncharacterized protein (TIGR02145 family)
MYIKSVVFINFNKGAVMQLKRLMYVCAMTLAALAGCGGDGGGGNPTDNSNNNNNNTDNNYTYSGGTVTIGGKRWMSKNLDRATANSWCYHNVNSNCAKYGRLYTWEAAKTACPSPWRLPTNAEWQSLVDAAGGESTAGAALKSSTDWDGNNSTGFSALPGGSSDHFGNFGDLGSWGFWWSATENEARAFLRGMHSGGAYVREILSMDYYGFSVRCLQD